MRISRLVAATALGSALVLTGCSDTGEEDEGVDTSIDGGGEEGEDAEDEEDSESDEDEGDEEDE